MFGLKELLVEKTLLSLTDEQVKQFSIRMGNNSRAILDYMDSLPIRVEKHTEMRFSSPTLFTHGGAYATAYNSIVVGMEWLKDNLSDVDMAELAAWRLEGKI